GPHARPARDGASVGDRQDTRLAGQSARRDPAVPRSVTGEVVLPSVRRVAVDTPTTASERRQAYLVFNGLSPSLKRLRRCGLRFDSRSDRRIDELRNVLSHHVELDVHARTGPSHAECGDLERVRNDGDVKASVAAGETRKARAV